MAATYTDTGVINGTTYYYKVSAVNPCAESPLSAEQNGTPHSPAPSFTPFASTHDVEEITSGPDGNLWVSSDEGVIIKVTTAGVRTYYTLTGGSAGGTGICTGPDGKVWVCDNNGNQIFKVTTGGVSTAIPIQYSPPLTPGPSPQGICAGPDGNLWFSDSEYAGYVWKMTTGGVGVYFALSDTGGVSAICSGPDGNLWVVDFAGNLWQVTTTGSLTKFILGGHLTSVCVGPDSNLWISDQTGFVWKFTIPGHVASSYPLAGASPSGICSGPDGNLWVTDNNGFVWIVAPNGFAGSYAVGMSADPVSICLGADNNLWFTDINNNFVWQAIPG